MISYQNRSQIEQELQNLLPHQLKECKECDVVPAALEQLIRHNYNAAFVCYDKKTGNIEIGVEEREDVTSYPEIVVHKFRLSELPKKLRKTFRRSDADLRFYAKLLAQTQYRKVDEVVLV